MAKELVVSLLIGGAVASSLRAATGGARTALKELESVTASLNSRQKALGTSIKLAAAAGLPTLDKLRAKYDAVGASIKQAAAHAKNLQDRLKAGEALRDARQQTWGAMKETAGAAVAVGAPVLQSVRLAAGFEDQLRDISITGGFSAREEAQLGTSAREASARFNQAQSEVLRGVQVLTAGGISEARRLQLYAPLMAKAATATRASMDDLGAVAIALNDNLKVGEAGFEGALNMLAYAGKRGQFEIRDMAKWLPALTPQFEALGVVGPQAVAEIGAALQIARKGAGSNDEAANNFRNFLNKITSPDTLKDFEKAGIDLQASMMNLRAKGMTPVQAMLGVITQYMQSKGPEAAARFESVMAIKDGKERETALARLQEAYKLGELFQDMQAMSFIRPAIANSGEFASIKAGALGAANGGLIDQDFAKRMETATEQFKAFRIAAVDLGISVGNSLLPALTGVVQAALPFARAFNTFAQENPGLVRGVIGLATGLIGARLALLSLSWGMNFFVRSPLNSVRTGIAAVQAGWTVLRARWLLADFAPMALRLRSMAGAAVSLGSALGGRLLLGLRVAGQAVLWLGRAMLMNPIGLAVTAIAGGAILVWKYWDEIKGALGAAWDWLKGLGQAFWNAGGALIDGLIGGVTSKLAAARDTIVNFGSSVTGWFKSTLGIHSPSRVFEGLGENIGQGAALGIERASPLASGAAADMATDATGAAARIRQARGGPGAVGASAGGGIVVHFQPTIHLQPGAGADAAAPVRQALQVSARELEQLLERIVAQRMRVAY